MFNLVFRRIVRFFLLAGLTFGLLVACNAQQPSTEAPELSTQPLVVASSPWPGFAPHYVALAKEFFQEEGILVEDQYFQIATDVNTALLAGKVDLAWTGVPDMVMMAERDPSLRLIALSDYSNGADGILARNVTQAQDLKGKEIAWEELPLQSLLLRKYLETGGLTEQDITLLTMPAAEAATAFASKQVDVAVTYEPWLSKAAQEGQGEIVFSSKNTNIIPVGLVVKEAILQQRKPEILAFLRAIDKGVQFVRQSPDEMAEITAQKLGVTPEEVPALLDTVRIFDMEENATVVFNADDPLNVIDSLEFAAKTSQEIKLISQPVDATKLYDDSLVKELQAS
ncbi:ABC transporter substrate-binding protein [Oscillatoria sp. FACHB-1407]|uniref:ABC transporter substrate-binding protein n=1 Tax=Oscillatoria sp. FACHB-1407 TaxID=2692847 RepID=UPI0016823EEE|nr:ABC transporter substrate-binding protein [Oscillatoria sp. FACHB-1407]MBD2462040.1 ABC transporter substrate-binding protein [Oscillatoria sp. FACHB-1407]